MPLRPPVHRPYPNMRREKRADPFYTSAEWRAFRAKVLAERGYRCCVQGCEVRATHLDHRIPIARGGARLERGNVDARCHSHHSSKTSTHDQKRDEHGQFSIRQ